MWIKICGNTNLQDCLSAAELGADAVGFVFAPGKRTVSAGQVAAMAAHLPPALETIGVFTTTDFDTIVSTVEHAGLTGVQLHGPVDPGLASRLRRHFGKRPAHCSVIQVLPWWTGLRAEEQQVSFAAQAREIAADGSADAVLVDSRTREASGGTGTTFDWIAAEVALRGIDSRIVVAGGLRPENVGQAIAALHPWGVDVASGVEAAPGRKNPEALARFIEEARRTPERVTRSESPVSHAGVRVL